MIAQVLFSINTPSLSDAQKEFITLHKGEWVVLHTKNGRELVNAIVDTDNISGIQSYLAEYSPVLIGVWDVDGNPVLTDIYPVNKVEHDSFLPYSPIQFAGWGDKVF